MRRSRKRKNVPREPNGRPSRRKADVKAWTEMTEKEAKSVGIAARLKHTGLPESLVDGKPETGKPNVGTAHGLLYLQNCINIDQWTAAEWYLGKRNEYLQAIKAPGAQWQAGGDPVDNADPEAYERWCLAAKSAWANILRCLHDASVDARAPILSAFDCILDRQITSLPHLYGELRCGLNAIYRAFLRVQRRAA